MRNTKKAFTLVELIVVITILAILGTIAFISLQGYSAEARNAKRTSDLSSVASSLSVKLTNGMSVLSAVADDTNQIPSIALAGSGAINDDTLYNAGSVNYTALDMKAEEFQDPEGNSYKMGATILDGGVYQIAASQESDGSNVALISGMYNQRPVDVITGDYALSSASTKTFTVDITETGKFKKGDYVGDGTNSGTITKVSSDGRTMTLSSTTLTGTTLSLVVSEEAGLIGAVGALDNAVVDGVGTNLPY